MILDAIKRAVKLLNGGYIQAADELLRQAIDQAEHAHPVAQYSDIVSDGGFDPRNKFDAPTRQPEQAQPVAIHQFRIPHCADWYDGIPDHHDGHGPYEVRTLYTAPLQTEREPVGTLTLRDDMGADITFQQSLTLLPGQAFALYTAPLPRQPLTDEEIKAVIATIDPAEQYLPAALRQFARAIEAAHGIVKGKA